MNEELINQLKYCSLVFRKYYRIHAAKGSIKKAEANIKIAIQIEQLLKKYDVDCSFITNENIDNCLK